MKIPVLTYSEKENKDEYDVVVKQVAQALEKKGHEATIIAVHGDVTKLVEGLEKAKPDLVFNLMEMFGKNFLADVAVVGFLDLLGLKHTGGGPGEFYLRQDKALAKKLLAYDNILYPKYVVFPKDEGFEALSTLRMPLFVKPLRMDSSIGIDGKSIVKDAEELRKRVEMIHEKVKDSALAEEFIEGREFYVGVIGNQNPQAFPPVELDFSGLPEGKPRIADAKAKWDKNSVEYRGTRAVLANLPDDVHRKLQKVAIDAYKALRVRDYGRVDLRLTPSEDVYVIEVNASCYLEKDSEFCMGAAAAGLDFPAVIQRIVDLAVERYKTS